MTRVDELFDLRYGHSLELNRLTRAQAPNGVNFVSRAMKNNGVTARVESALIPGEAGELTVALSGNGILSTFVQPEPFVTGYHVMILRPLNSDMVLTEKLWWARCILANRYRYSYGRQANRSLASLELPNFVPDWALHTVVPDVLHMEESVTPPTEISPVTEWGRYRLGELFEIRRGKYIPKIDQRPGLTPVVTSSSFKNGVSKYLDIEPIFPAGSISVARNGSIGEAYFQPVPFFASDDAHIFIPNAEIDRFASLFVCAVIRMEQFRYGYGRKWSLERMNDTWIALPTSASGSPDWHAMSSFMQGLPYSSAI
ncbi:restriction endonuclease subunit S [Salinibacterium sp. SWN1162]|uniref:restriction endonuclease subunit S n=1 Tax=Salinibacterium sp. SWN1162 TaxID=2792053 RepID=UPI0018CE03D3|nr:restriction endonuclease subunit S [Salinibacterium sp. SWN1162]MBH0009030.1 restriction endonuclease subunit S [Salinibacterium sp. SWN1162]